MIKQHLISVLLSSSLLLSCATTPGQDSDFIVYGEEMEGPGVFTGDTGKAVFFEDRQQPTTSSASDGESSTTSPRMSEMDWQEFSAFKRWLKSRQHQDENYQEFQQWLRYEKYLQWQHAQ